MVAGCSLATLLIAALSVDTMERVAEGFLDFRTDTTGGTDLLAMRLDNSQDLFVLTNRQALVMQDLRYSTSTGQVTYDTSSRLVKDQIEDIPYGLTEVLALSPKKYVRTDTKQSRRDWFYC